MIFIRVIVSNKVLQAHRSAAYGSHTQLLFKLPVYKRHPIRSKLGQREAGLESKGAKMACFRQQMN